MASPPSSTTTAAPDRPAPVEPPRFRVIRRLRALRVRSAWDRPSRAKFWSVALSIANLVLLLAAVQLGEGSVRDGSVTVTSGSIVTMGILATLALAFLLPRLLALPRRAAWHLRAFLLGGQTLHAFGHLARLYYTYPAYDTFIHFALTAWIALVAVVLFRAKGILPDRHATPTRVALAALLAGLASASVWETFEFSMDQLTGTREQDNLTDTMVDTLAATAGSALAAVGAAIASRGAPFATRYQSVSKG